jgi:hypothetical protein
MPDSPDADRLRHEMLEEELEAARRKRESYHALLKDLPEVFEGKFRERVRPVQQRNEQLLEEGMALREQIRRALPQAGVAGASLPPATETVASADRGTDPEELRKEAWKPAGPAGGLRRAADRLRSAGVAGALAAGLALGLGGLLLAANPWRSGGESQPTPRPTARPTPPGMATPSAPVPASNASPAVQTGAPQAGVPSISLRTTGPSWVEVRSTDGVLLFSGEFKGERSFPLRNGVMIRSGRADLVYLQVNGQPERKLGSINWLNWTTFQPALPARPGAGRQP